MFMDHNSQILESQLPELPQTKEDIEWKYFYCEECNTETGYMGDMSNACCAKCTLEQADIVKEYTVSMDYGKMDKARKVGTKDKYCLLDHLSTDDEETKETIMKECASMGCNVCLSKISEDIIEWPKHYNMGKIQPIDAIEDWKLDFRLANAVKYIARAGKKDPAKTKQDLEKALWYIRRFIDKEC